MGIDGVAAPEIGSELSNRLDEGQRFDIADRAADLAEDEILALEVGLDEFLDRVGDVRDDLDGGAEILAPPLESESAAYPESYILLVP